MNVWLKRGMPLLLCLGIGLSACGTGSETETGEASPVAHRTEPEAGAAEAGAAESRKDPAPAAQREEASPPRRSSEPPAEKGIALLLPEEISTAAGEIPYVIQNTTGAPVDIVLIPQLECREDGDWTVVPMQGVGFCGTPDSIGETYEDVLPMDWYPEQLPAGEYRLSFARYDPVNGTGDDRIEAVFVIVPSDE